jgi:hypothetical protein
MPASKDTLKERLARRRPIKITVIAGSRKRQSRFRSGSYEKARRFTSCLSRDRMRSGIGTCSRTRRFGLMHAGGAEIPSDFRHRCEDGEIGDREIPREVWREGHEELSLEIRCGGFG